MKTSKIFTTAIALTMLFNISCRNDDPVTPDPKGAYENGIIIVNEGGFTKPTSSADFLNNNWDLEKNIYSTNNNNELLGNVFQSIGFKNDDAYLVMNVPNKIEVVNRYTFKKSATISSNLDNPRYIAFSGNNTYVTNNNFYNVMKLNVYDANNTYVKSINFDRYAEKVVSSGGYVYVQTDGTGYDANYNPFPTGHTITRINPANNEIDKTITLTDTAIIKDVIADSSYVYVLTSDDAGSYLYKIDGSAGTFEKINLTGVTNAAKLALDNNKLYFVSDAKKLYALNGNKVETLFDVETSHIYGFNVINGYVYVSDPSFSQDSTTRIYSTTGGLIKTLTTGVGTRDFYRN